MPDSAIQDQYPEDYAHCYGCGRLNENGLHIKSYWEGDECVCKYQPESYYTGGLPNFLYGGMTASLIDCHSASAAVTARSRQQGNEGDDAPLRGFVTASLKVDYLNPTPVNELLELRSTIKEIKGRKVIVSTVVTVNQKVCAKGEAIMVQIPEEYDQVKKG